MLDSALELADPNGARVQVDVERAERQDLAHPGAGVGDREHERLVDGLADMCETDRLPSCGDAHKRLEHQGRFGPATGQYDALQTLFTSLVDPGRDIPPAASAVHHLTAENVAGQPGLPEALTAAVRAFQPHVLVAHNAMFEVGFLPDLAGALTPEDARWACTLRLARHLWPGWAGGFGLQTLPYACRLGHALPDGDPHRAGYDAACVAALLPVQCRALTDAGHDVTPALLRDRSATIPLLARVPFGLRYRGRLWRDVPASFCEWILRTHRTGDPFDPEIVATAEAALRGGLRDPVRRGRPRRSRLNRPLPPRDQALCILVGSPALFEPDCHTPRQMRMANGLCRFRELARTVQPDG